MRPPAAKRLAKMPELQRSMSDPRIRKAIARICAKHGCENAHELASKHPKVFDDLVADIAELNEQAPVERTPGFLR